jgi:hypothetical protein
MKQVFKSITEKYDEKVINVPCIFHWWLEAFTGTASFESMYNVTVSRTNETRTYLLYTLSQAWRVTENDFDILVARFYILKTNEIIEPYKKS